MTKDTLNRLYDNGYLLCYGRVFDTVSSKVLKKGQMSTKEWNKFKKFLFKVALIGFSIGLVGFAIIDFSLRIK